jgi:hypothetical protein
MLVGKRSGMKNREKKTSSSLVSSKKTSNVELSLDPLTQEELDELRREMRRDGLWMQKKLRSRHSN